MIPFGKSTTWNWPTDRIWSVLRHRFQKAPFSTVHPRKESFLKQCVFKRLHFSKCFRKSPFTSAFSSVLLQTTSKKCIERYGVSNENALVRMGFKPSLGQAQVRTSKLWEDDCEKSFSTPTSTLTLPHLAYRKASMWKSRPFTFASM